MGHSSNAAFSRVSSEFVSPENLTLHNIAFVFFELSSTGIAFRNTLILCISAATIGTVMALVIAYISSRQVIAWHKALGFLATAPVAVQAGRSAPRYTARQFTRRIRPFDWLGTI
jgi:iron(III) transport system permease protein